MMSTGKKKKPSKKSSQGSPILLIIFGAVAGLVMVGALIWGGMTVLGKRMLVAGYQASVAKITETLKARDPESTQEAVRLIEIDAMITGTPTVTRETKDGAEYAVYTWGGSGVGFRLQLEQNGSIDEVVELKTFGAE